MDKEEEIFINKIQTLTKIEYIADLCTRCKDETLNHDFFLLEYGRLLAQLPEEYRVNFIKDQFKPYFNKNIQDN